jgi:hypothetical protein
MCEKCAELDERICRYRRLADSINDQLTIDRLKQLVVDLLAEKVTLHADQGGYGPH